MLDYIIGAYASAPTIEIDNRDAESKFYEELTASIPNIKGLEIPFWGEDVHIYGLEFLLSYIRPHWDNVLTCIPGSVTALKTDRHFGIASTNDLARREAVKMHKRANEVVQQVCDHFGRKAIMAVHLATAPGCPAPGVSRSIDSLQRSMDEILSWDWNGARLVIEHCDTAIGECPPQKGFMSIEEEISVLNFLKSEYNVGITLNWGRSAIEGKSPDQVIEHIKVATANNLLSGFIFSGTAIDDKKYGSWTDSHMPFAPAFNSKFHEEHSLLTPTHVRETLEALDIENLDYIGVKLLSKQEDKTSTQRRVGINKDAIAILESIQQG